MRPAQLGRVAGRALSASRSRLHTSAAPAAPSVALQGASSPRARASAQAATTPTPQQAFEAHTAAAWGAPQDGGRDARAEEAASALLREHLAGIFAMEPPAATAAAGLCAAPAAPSPIASAARPASTAVAAARGSAQREAASAVQARLTKSCAKLAGGKHA